MKSLKNIVMGVLVGANLGIMGCCSVVDQIPSAKQSYGIEKKYDSHELGYSERLKDAEKLLSHYCADGVFSVGEQERVASCVSKSLKFGSDYESMARSEFGRFMFANLEAKSPALYYVDRVNYYRNQGQSPESLCEFDSKLKESFQKLGIKSKNLEVEY